AAESAEEKTGKLELWNIGIMEHPFLFPPFHDSILPLLFSSALSAASGEAGERKAFASRRARRDERG
ncbi:MAG TPA: hypothetical protein VF372_07705, partial [Thermodesulfobacteriota bacterium]